MLAYTLRVMGSRRTTPQSFEDFRDALAEEMNVSAEFSLPLTLLAAVLDVGWEDESTGRAVGALRAADLVSRPTPSEIVVALPNTGPENARLVEWRIREGVPECRMGMAVFEPGDTAEALVDRAIAAARGS